MKPKKETVQSWWPFSNKEVEVAPRLTLDDGFSVQEYYMRNQALVSFKNDGLLKAINYTP